MDANGTKFHLLLGEEDWSNCSLVDQERRTPLRVVFESPLQTCDERAGGVDWVRDRNELTLRPCLFRFIAPRNDRPPQLSDRRGAARDCNGNWYWIDKTRREIRINSSGTTTTSHFWTACDGLECERTARFGEFQPKESRRPPIELQLSGLAVTEDHYLVVGALDPPGLLIFDLHTGGPPRQVIWPESVPFQPFDMAPRSGGGVWILDRENARMWALDRHFNVLEIGSPQIVSTREEFQPVDGTCTRETVSRRFPEPIWINVSSPIGARDPISIEALPDGSVLILDRNPDAAYSVVYHYDEANLKGEISLEDFNIVAHDFAFVSEHETPKGKVGDRVYVVDSQGNQTFAFEIVGERLGLDLSPEYYPMRLFGGKGLVAAGPDLYYDFGDGWIPLIEQRRPRFGVDATIETPIGEPRHAFDSGEPDCVWHRLMLDACIPPDADVQVWSRAANDERQLEAAPWFQEPQPYLRGDGSELPFLPNSDALRTRPFPDALAEEQNGRQRRGRIRADGDGTWDLLFQRAHGRFLQLRIKLVGNGQATPRLRALRVYFPRFSYLERYLPALYREDSQSASFLDRFLANLEGFYTAIEDRIAAAQILFDIRSAPREVLEWLASWLGVALDPAWDEERKRLFIKHAMTFFQYRGTIPGVRMALRLALDESVDDTVFTDVASKCKQATGIRVVEKYLTRRTPGVVFGDPTDLEGIRSVPVGDRWYPEHGGVRLHELYRADLGRPAGEVFPTDNPGGDLEARWREFAQARLGFVPVGAADDRKRWQDFLLGRYEEIESLNQAYGGAYSGFAQIPMPATTPPEGIRHSDWAAFTLQSDVSVSGMRRRLWQDFLARRYQRIEALNQAYGTGWRAFANVPLPDVLPPDGASLRDWYQFEGVVLAMHRAAHRFTVLAPMPKKYRLDAAEHQRRRDLAKRIVNLEKPAHTVFDVKFYWALFLVGQARLGEDSVLDVGSRAPEFMSPMVLGRGSLSETFLSDE